MKIMFRSIQFSAFKGGQPIHMTFDQGINTIAGANGSGKSTVLDAIIWCLFGKDFINRTKFPLIPLNPDGSIQQVSPSVTLEIAVDGELITLSRRIDGSKTACEINDAPCKTLAEYDKYIASLFSDEQRFKMFTMPLYFTEALSWQDQRTLLMRFFQDPEPAAVFGRMKDEKIRYSKDLVDSMSRMQPAEYIAKHDKSLKDVETRKERIRAQLQLLDDQLDGNQAIDQAALEAERAVLRRQIAEINDAITEAVAGNRAILVKAQQQDTIVRLAQAEIDRIQLTARNSFDRKLEQHISDLTFKRVRKADLVRQFQERSAAVDLECPMCHQSLPSATVAGVRSRQHEALQQITQQGVALKDAIADLEQRIDAIKDAGVQLAPVDAERVRELEQATQAAQECLRSLPKIKDVPQADEGAQARLDEISRALARIDVHRENIQRKAALEAEERQLSQEYEQHTIAIAEASKFAFYRSALVIEAVNSHFKSISVKVLDVQKNGVARETFEITSNGVPYSGLNKTGRLSASLELMEFLKGSLGVESPVIIDDVENYPDLDLSTIGGQLIVAFAKARHPLQVIGKYPQDI